MRKVPHKIIMALCFLTIGCIEKDKKTNGDSSTELLNPMVVSSNSVKQNIHSRIIASTVTAVPQIEQKAVYSQNLALTGGVPTLSTGTQVSSNDISGVSVVDAGDIDGDGLIDIVAAEGGKHAGGRKFFSWFQQPASATSPLWPRFSIAETMDIFEPFIGALKLADMNQDGKLDIVVSSDRHSGGLRRADLFVFINPGKDYHLGTWQKIDVELNAERHHINDMEIADIDGDGLNDIITRSLYPNRILVYFQNSDNTYTVKETLTEIAHSEGLAVGDINQDERPDISFTGYFLVTPALIRN